MIFSILSQPAAESRTGVYLGDDLHKYNKASTRTRGLKSSNILTQFFSYYRKSSSQQKNASRFILWGKDTPIFNTDKKNPTFLMKITIKCDKMSIKYKKNSP